MFIFFKSYYNIYKIKVTKNLYKSFILTHFVPTQGKCNGSIEQKWVAKLLIKIRIFWSGKMLAQVNENTILYNFLSTESFLIKMTYLGPYQTSIITSKIH